MTYDERNKEKMHNLFTASERDDIYRAKGKLQSMLNLYVGLYPPLSMNYIVAGGIFPSLLNDDNIHDVDVFVLSTTQDIVEAFMKNPSRFTQKGPVRNDEYHNGNQKSHIIGVFNDKNNYIQYILTNYKTRQEVISNFDFVHSMVSYEKDNLYITRPMYDAIIKKRLIPNIPKDRINQKRFEKFKSRGYREVDSI